MSVPMGIRIGCLATVPRNSIVGTRTMGNRKVNQERVVGRRVSRMGIHLCKRPLRLERRVIGRQR